MTIFRLFFGYQILGPDSLNSMPRIVYDLSRGPNIFSACINISPSLEVNVQVNPRSISYDVRSEIFIHKLEQELLVLSTSGQ